MITLNTGLLAKTTLKVNFAKSSKFVVFFKSQFEFPFPGLDAAVRGTVESTRTAMASAYQGNLPHTKGQQGGNFPVQLRFADLPPEHGGTSAPAQRARAARPPPRQVVERGLTTADLKARVALKERESVRPPDQEKLGQKQSSKSALAGARAQEYGTESYSNANLVHTKVGPRWAERVPTLRNKVHEPGYGLLLKWAEQSRTFRRKQHETELTHKNAKLKQSVQNIQKREAAIVAADLRPPEYYKPPPYNPPKIRHPSELQVQREREVYERCPGFFEALGGSSSCPPPTKQAGTRRAGGAKGGPPKLSMYDLDGLLFPAPSSSVREQDGGVGAWVWLSLDRLRIEESLLFGSERLAWKDVKARVCEDLETEIAVFLELSEKDVVVEKVVRREDGGKREIWALVLLLPSAADQDAQGDCSSSGVLAGECADELTPTLSHKKADMRRKGARDEIGTETAWGPLRHAERLKSVVEENALAQRLRLGRRGDVGGMGDAQEDALSGLDMLKMCLDVRVIKVKTPHDAVEALAHVGTGALEEAGGTGGVHDAARLRVEAFEEARFRAEVREGVLVAENSACLRCVCTSSKQKEKAMRELRRTKCLKPCPNTGARYTTARARIFAG